MAKKATAGGSKNLSSKSSPKTETGTTASTASSSTGRSPAPPAPVRVPASSNPNFILPFVFLCFSIFQMLNTNEAPKRPFALLKDASAEHGERLIQPRILLVTPHPDDEVICAPTVLSLLSEEKKKDSAFYALTLSTGDAFGEGKRREKELKESWDVLGLDEGRRFILDHPKLRDGNDTWDATVIAEQVAPFVIEYDIDTILSFDSVGITGNPNHVSIEAGIKTMLASSSFTKMLSKQKNRITPRLYTLKSEPWTKQYSILTPLIEHFMLSIQGIMFDAEKAKAEGFRLPTIFLSGGKNYYRAWKALLCHRSQLHPKSLLVWAAARYLWTNEWVEV